MCNIVQQFKPKAECTFGNANEINRLNRVLCCSVLTTLSIKLFEHGSPYLAGSVTLIRLNLNFMLFFPLVARHGSGKMTFVSGAVYEGQWQYDKSSGYGTLKFPDGTIQQGTWKEGSLDGCVIFTWPHGVTEYREYGQGGG